MKKYILSFLFMVSLLGGGQVFAGETLSASPTININRTFENRAELGIQPGENNRVRTAQQNGEKLFIGYQKGYVNDGSYTKVETFNLNTTLNNLESNTEYSVAIFINTCLGGESLSTPVCNYGLLKASNDFRFKTLSRPNFKNSSLVINPINQTSAGIHVSLEKV